MSKRKMVNDDPQTITIKGVVYTVFNTRNRDHEVSSSYFNEEAQIVLVKTTRRGENPGWFAQCKGLYDGRYELFENSQNSAEEALERLSKIFKRYYEGEKNAFIKRLEKMQKTEDALCRF